MTDFLAAVSVGPAVPRPNFEAEVHSVFRTTVNLRRTDDAILLTLLLSPGPDLPQGVRIPSVDAAVLQRLRMGASAICRDDTLMIGDDLVVDLHDALRPGLSLSSLHADLMDPGVQTAWRHASEALRRKCAGLDSARQPPPGESQHASHELIVARRLEIIERSILEATAAYDTPSSSSLGELIGLGSGLTPSGDDFLVGYLAGLWCTIKRKPERLSFLVATADLVARLSTRTNDISRTYLCLAARGQVSSLLLDLASCICTPASETEVAAAAEAAMHFGQTSGIEAVRGLLLGLAAWDAADLIAAGYLINAAI